MVAKIVIKFLTIVVIFTYSCMAKNIYQVAAKFEKKLLKLANFPDPQRVTPIIQRVVDSAKEANKQLLGSVKDIASVSVENTIDNLVVYFQLVVDPSKYTQLINEPYKSDIKNTLKPLIEQALNSSFRPFDFKAKIGIVS